MTYEFDLVFERLGLPVFVVLSFVVRDDIGNISTNVSVRSHVSQDLGFMLEIQSTWREWIRSALAGEDPAYPSGWRVVDGPELAATFSGPDHVH